MKDLSDTLDALCKHGCARHFAGIARGIEKESLRVRADGMLAQTPHPHALGAALTHPCITTDYAEALLELVTPKHNSVRELLGELFAIHHFVYKNLGAEKLWVNSMPCIVPHEENIAIASYGASNIAKMKEAYRRGLQLRYGSLMQTIAGIHFNFSLPEKFWREVTGGDGGAARARKSKAYFSLIRNFHRYAWLGCYLFGASPAVCKSFPQGRAHSLRELDAHTFYAPHATSLRLSNLGYNSSAQVGIGIDYNSLQKFVASLRSAIRTPHARYKKFGVKAGGEYRQLNANILQIENEFYSVIRPKRVTESGVSPSRALLDGGVEYVEVRSIDLNPFAPLGIDEECVRFFDMLLLACLFSASPPLGADEWKKCGENRRRVVMEGRRPGLELCADGRGKNSFRARAESVLRMMRPLAELLDEVCAHGAYVSVWESQLQKVRDAEATPSARILREMRAHNESFYEFGLRMSALHEKRFKQKPMPARALAAMRKQAAQSHARRRAIERADTAGFDEFLAAYFRRQNAK